MAVGNNFALVRDAFCANLAENLRRLNVEVKSQTPKGDWLQVNCPFCNDRSGSASISVRSGFLRCHQCSAKEDLFSWTGKAVGCSVPWLQCQTLAKIVGVVVEGAARSKHLWRACPELTPETWSDFQQRLYEDEESEICREFLRRRGLWKPEKLEELPIGAWGGRIVFAQHNGSGKLLKRARVYNPFPTAESPKWTWNKVKGQTGRTVGFWPIIPRILNADPQLEQLVLEGEWDVVAAILNLDILNKMVVTTWTGGAGSPVPVEAIYEHMRRRKTHLLYDNDVFQGVGEDLAPDNKKLAELKQRKKNLLDVVGPSFVANQCHVFVRAITIDPMVQWGADLRDMIDAGLQSIDELPAWKLNDCRKTLREAKRVEFAAVHKHLNQYVEFRCQVAGVADEVSIKPMRCAWKCEMNQFVFCQNCKAPEIAPNGVIDFTDRQAELACAMTDNNMPRHLADRVIGKPSQCKVWHVNPVDSSDGARWTAMPCEDDTAESARTVEILSDVAPPLSGELLVRGWLFISANGLTPVLMCDHLEAADLKPAQIEPHKVALLGEVPHATDDVEQIDAYLERWSKDVANNTTHVYGRHDMHVLLGLTMHSSLWFDAFGARRRGWLDTCIIGATRTGKSAATRAYLKAIGLGQHFTPMGNYSRPGLTIGTISLNGQSKSKPGVFPRNHGKLVALDESHLMVQDNAQGGGLFPMLQGARDIGRVEAAKISGSQQLQSAVRLIAISNWLQGSKHSFATPAHHLLSLYGTPESLSRLDFAIPVEEIEAGFGAEETYNFWSIERQRVLAIRAWQMGPEHIVFTDEALEEAQRLCRFVWKDRYTEELPLFTEKEKVYSVLRIAIAIANMTLSHPEGNISRCHVRLVHVQWAAKWLEKTWSLLEYDAVSRTTRRRMEPRLIWRVEALLTSRLNLFDPAAVGFVLGKMFGLLGREELRTVAGLTYQDFEKWTLELLRCGALEVVRPTGNAAFGNQLAMRFTKGAIELIQQLIFLSENAPEIWSWRVDKVMQWAQGGSGPSREAPATVPPLDAPIEVHIDAVPRQQQFD